MEEQIRPKLLRVMDEYLAEKAKTFGGNEFGRFVRNELVDSFYNLDFIDPAKYIVKGSVGQGNWAQVPWIAIMNKNVTTTTQEGYYIVYLFSEDMERLYLTLAQGVTNNTSKSIEQIKQDIRDKLFIHPNTFADNNLYIGESSKAKNYRDSVALYIPYEKNGFPNEKHLQNDLAQMINYYEEYIQKSNSAESEGEDNLDLKDDQIVQHIHSFIEAKGFHYGRQDLINYFLSLKTKPFVILSGISGTGKTKIVELFAESVGANDENGRFKLIPVRPDWSDSSDLLGYTDIQGEFKKGPLTEVLLEAERNLDKPYFVLLDEMNLARVEYYFSDILSVMESRKWNDAGQIVTSELLPFEVDGQKLIIPENIYFIGTVNMDETTHPFSKKVLDRANTIEFNHIQLDAFPVESFNKLESIPLSNEQLMGTFLQMKDAFSKNEDLVRKYTDRLIEINKILSDIGAQVGYRVRDEISFYMIYNQKSGLLDEKEAFDYQLLQKILPRINGSDVRVDAVLKDLFRYCTSHDYSLDEVRNSDFFEHVDFPKSARKIAEMIRRFEQDGFTSFWL